MLRLELFIERFMRLPENTTRMVLLPLEMMSGRHASVAAQLSQEFRDTILKNRQMLRSIVETITLCGRQSIALRGHRDSAWKVRVQSQTMGLRSSSEWQLMTLARLSPKSS